MNHAHRLGQWAYKHDQPNNPYHQKEQPQKTHWQCGYNHAQQYHEKGFITIPPQPEPISSTA